MNPESYINSPERIVARKELNSQLIDLKRLDEGYKDEDRIVSDAIEYMFRAHIGQKRKSGEPYHYHPIAVAHILLNLGITDRKMIAATILHDVVEDVACISSEDIENKFGKDVKFLVDGVTKLKGFSDQETAEHILILNFEDPRIGIIKLADRLHNMRTLGSLTSEKQVLKARETLDIYVPLAEALGIWVMKEELEDLSYKYLHPKAYTSLTRAIEKDSRFCAESKIAQISKLEYIMTSIYPNSQLYQAGNKYVLINLDTNELVYTIDIKTTGICNLAYKLNKKGIVKFSKKKELNAQMRTVDSVIRYVITCHTSQSESIFSKLIDDDNNDPNRLDIFTGKATRNNGYQAKHITLNEKDGAIKFIIVTEDQKARNSLGVIHLFNSADLEGPESGRGIKDFQNYQIKPILVDNQTQDNSKPKLIFVPNKFRVLDVLVQTNRRMLPFIHQLRINGVHSHYSSEIPLSAAIEFEVDILNPRKLAISENEILLFSDETIRWLSQQKEQIESKNKIEIGARLIRRISKELGLWDLRDMQEIFDPIAQMVLEDPEKTLDDLLIAVATRQILVSSVESQLLKNKSKGGRSFHTIGAKGLDQENVLKRLTDAITQMGGHIIKTPIIKWQNDDLFGRRESKTKYECRYIFELDFLDKDIKRKVLKELKNSNVFETVFII